MEILKFSEPPKRAARSNTRKKGGMMPLLSIVATVALVGGMSTTLAGTITLNSDTSVEFGQGVVTAAACDTSVTILPTASYDTNTASSFKVSEVKIQGLGLTTAADGPGCRNKKLVIRAYALNSNSPLAWDGVTNGTNNAITLDLPDSETLTAGLIGKGIQAFSMGSTNAYDAANTSTTSSTGQFFIVNGLAFSSDVVRFTIESSDK